MIIEIILLLLLANLILGIYLYNQVKNLYKYPNVFGFPVLGNLYYFYKTLLICNVTKLVTYYSDISEKRGMDMFFTFIHGKPGLILACPNLVEEIANNPYVADKAECLYAPLRHIMYGPFGSVTSDDEWKIKRKELNKALNKSLIDGPYHDAFVRFGRELVQQINDDPKRVDIVYYLHKNFMNVVKVTFFKMKEFLHISPTMVNDIKASIHIAGAAMSNPIFGYLFRHLTKFSDLCCNAPATQQRKELLTTVRQELKNLPPALSEDLSKLPIAIAVGLRNAKNNKPEGELKAELMELLMTTSHTTASVAVAALAYLATLPHIQDKIWKEQHQIFGTSDREATADDIKQMTYLDRVVKETIRFISPPSIMKYTSGEINLGGAVIPAEMCVTILLHKMGKDPRFWTDPDVFDPDRFLMEESLPKYAYAPFGVGIRSCPGKQYAYHHIKTIISTVSRTFKISTVQSFKDLKYEMGLMTEISNLSPLQAEERKHCL